MELVSLKQPPLCTTLMSSIKGASNYFGLDWSIAKLFGYSSHAFLINIHADLCPSSPYVWRKDGFFLALRDMGIRRTDTICVQKGASVSEITQAESELKSHLNAGKPCMLDFMEHQLVAGYDSEGFLFLQPWNGVNDVELSRLSFGSWNEALDLEDRVQFTFLEAEECRADESLLLQSALNTALQMRSSPAEFEMSKYCCGDGAWESWLSAIYKGMGNSHGHWWSGTVWMECRKMAADFFDEIEPAMRNAKLAALCRELANLYRECGDYLEIAKSKEAETGVQRAALTEGRELDLRCAGLMKELLSETIDEWGTGRGSL
jgi:hypothetical protein